MELNKIYKGDCLETLKTLPSESVDCCITSPPYNKNGFRGRKDTSKGQGRWSGADISYGDFEDNIDEELYENQQVELLDEIYRVLKPDGSVFYNHKVRRNDGEASHPFSWIGKSKLNFYQQIVWDRGSCVDHNVNYLDPTTELIFWLVKDKPKVFKTSSRFSGEIWRMNPDYGNEHPAPFPELLVKICLELTTKPGDLILDPYLGSGTTAVVAKQNSRNYIGCELNPDYIKISEERLKGVTKSMF